jgi:hypothetical protein
MKNPINRGNGVANDNLASLADLLIVNHDKLKEVQKEVREVRRVIGSIDSKNTPREIKSFWLLIISVVFAAVAIVINIIFK